MSVKVPSYKTKIRTMPRSARQNLVSSLRLEIKIIGIGSGGGSIVSEIAQKVKGASFIGADTDIQALKAAPKDQKIFQILLKQRMQSRLRN